MEAYRGGLLSNRTTGTDSKSNMLEVIVGWTDKREEKKLDREYYQSIDENLLAVLNLLRELKLFKKEDILEHNLLRLFYKFKMKFFLTK